MTPRILRRLAMLGFTSAIVATFAVVALASRGVTLPQLLLAASSFVFCYVVIRLSESMLASDPERRERARRRLILAIAVPALVLTPAAVESSAAEYRWQIIGAGVVWLTLAMAFTSFLLAKAPRESRNALASPARGSAASFDLSESSVPGDVRRRQPAPAHHGTSA